MTPAWLHPTPPTRLPRHDSTYRVVIIIPTGLIQSSPIPTLDKLVLYNYKAVSL